MTIKKYLHSCLLIEEGSSRLLIDPAVYSFGRGRFAPEDVGPVDIILITHKHMDHYDPAILRVFAEMKDTVIITHDEIGALLESEGMKYQPIKAGDTLERAGFSVKAFPARHGPLPIGIPENLAYLINKKLFHPGDSLSFEAPLGLPVLALPVAGPWMRLRDAVEVAKKLTPKHVIPIHDALYVEAMRDRVSEMCAPIFKQSKIGFHPLGPGEVLSV